MSESLRRAKQPHTPQSCSLFAASFETVWLTARAYLNTQKYGLFCSLRSHLGFFYHSKGKFTIVSAFLV